MSKHTYPIRPELSDAEFSHAITAAFPPLTKFYVRCSGDDCVIDFPKLERDRDQIDTLNSVVTSYSGLEAAKLRRLADIDVRTLELITLVFTTGAGSQPQVTAAAVALRSDVISSITKTEVDAVVDNRD